MARVVLSSPLSIDVAPLLPGHELVGGARALGRAELLDALGDADGLICLLSDRVDAELVARAPRLRVVANHAVGVDNIDRAACAARGVAVANTPDVLTDATADLAFALILAVARRVVEGDALVRAGAWTGWAPDQLLGADLAGRTLGVVGLGRIGRALARRAAGFGMDVVYAQPRPGADAAGRHLALAELLAVADVVSLHCPLTPATRGLIGAAELARMKPTAILINTARGPIVDEDALAAALVAGRLGGAGLDVYAREPGVPDTLRAAPRCVLLPHIGSATHETRARMATLCAQAVRAVLAGERPANLVPPLL
jgi:glyoxylate reductase